MQVQTFRKSWPNYIRPIATILVLSFIIRWLFSSVASGAEALNFFQKLSLGVCAILVVWIIRELIRSASLYSCKITVGPEGINAKEGVLPWSKHQKNWEPDQIYSVETKIPKLGFLHWLVRHRHLVIRGREGSTEGTVYTYIGNAIKAEELGNSIRLRLHKPLPHDSGSETRQLKKETATQAKAVWHSGRILLPINAQQTWSLISDLTLQHGLGIPGAYDKTETTLRAGLPLSWSSSAGNPDETHYIVECEEPRLFSIGKTKTKYNFSYDIIVSEEDTILIFNRKFPKLGFVETILQNIVLGKGPTPEALVANTLEKIENAANNIANGLPHGVTPSG